MKNKCFEDYLYDQHAKQYTGTDDLMPDDWGEWVADLDVDQLIKFADAWMKEEILTAKKEGLEDFCKWLEETGYLDSDWWCEEPKAIDRYLAEKSKLKEGA